MAAHLPTELRKFAGHCTTLRNNYRETRLATHDLKAGAAGTGATAASSNAADSGIASNASSTPSSGANGTTTASAACAPAADFLELSREDENVIRQTIDARPALIVLGTSYHAKARVVNELFRKNVMPTMNSHNALPGSAVVNRMPNEASDLHKPKTPFIAFEGDRRRCSTANPDLYSPVVGDALSNTVRGPSEMKTLSAAAAQIDERNFFYRILRFHYRPRYACGLTHITHNTAGNSIGSGNIIIDAEHDLTSSIPRTLTNGSATSNIRRGSYFRQKISVASNATSTAGHISSESPVQFSTLSSSAANEERAGTVPLHMLRAPPVIEEQEQSDSTSGANLATSDRSFRQANTIVDVGLCHPLLKEGWRVLVGATVPLWQHRTAEEIQKNGTAASVAHNKSLIVHNIELLVERLADQKANASLPIFIYAIDCGFLNAQHQIELNALRHIVGRHRLAVFFLRIPSPYNKVAETPDETGAENVNNPYYEQVLAEQYYRKSFSASKLPSSSSAADQNNNNALIKPGEASLLLTAPCSLSDDSDDLSESSSSSTNNDSDSRRIVMGKCPRADMLASYNSKSSSNDTRANSHTNNKAADVDSGCEQHSSSTSNYASRSAVSTAELLKMQLYNLGYQFSLPSSSSSFFSSSQQQSHNDQPHDQQFQYDNPTICGDASCCRVWCREPTLTGDRTNTTRDSPAADAAGTGLRRHRSKNYQSRLKFTDTTTTNGAAVATAARRLKRKSRRQLRMNISGSSTASSSSCSHKKHILDTYTQVCSFFVDADVVAPGVTVNNNNNGTNSNSAASGVDNFSSIVLFVRKLFQTHLVRAATTLNDFQERCLVELTHIAFDLSREASVLPRRLQYVKEQEEQLYNSLNNVIQCRQEEIQHIVCESIASLRAQLLTDAEQYSNYRCASRSNTPTVVSGRRSPINVVVPPNMPNRNGSPRPLAAVCANEIRELILKRLNNAIAARILERVRCVRESFTGTLKRCLIKLEEHSDDLMMKNGLPSIAALSAASSMNNLANFGDDDEYDAGAAGTNAAMPHGRQVNAIVASALRRAQQQQQQQTDSTTSSALDHILNAAYSLELNAENSTSLLTTFKQRLMKSFALTGKMWKGPISCSSSSGAASNGSSPNGVGCSHNSNTNCVDDADWRRQIAADFIAGLSTERVSRLICQQFHSKLRNAHELFLASLRQLELRLVAKLERAEKTKRVVRKVHAPRLARLALESHSLRDTVLFGIPQPGRELGRGQYGVVHACDTWAGRTPCAVKSVVPPDERHRNDLALEIFYTKSVLPHPRLVQIYGSVMDYGYGDSDLASGPSVLIVMERLPRDLYHALKRGLNWLTRLQIALDVIEGIRYLHARGFIHRDIKLKNVLLDKRWRAKLTDFGFCKPNSLISGSVVGTPIHMAPEVFAGGLYGNSVDIYAFGILYWFLCAGRVRLPQAFEPWMSRDLLRSSVKRGVRPERLPEFDDDSWALMQACWAPLPEQRPLPGDVEEKLRDIQRQYSALAQMRRSASSTSSTVLNAGASSSFMHGGGAHNANMMMLNGGGIGNAGLRGLHRVRQRDVLVGGASTPYVELDIAKENEQENYADDVDEATPTAGNLMHLHQPQQQRRAVPPPPPPPCDEVDGIVPRRAVDARCRQKRAADNGNDNIDEDELMMMMMNEGNLANANDLARMHADRRESYYPAAVPAVEDDLANIITPT